MQRKQAHPHKALIFTIQQLIMQQPITKSSPNTKTSPNWQLSLKILNKLSYIKQVINISFDENQTQMQIILTLLTDSVLM